MFTSPGTGVSKKKRLPTEDGELISASDVRDEIARLFGASDDLVIKIHGGDADESGAYETYQELLRSLEHTGAAEGLLAASGAQQAATPKSDALARAFAILSRRDVQAALLTDILSGFGHQLIRPISGMLDASQEGMLFEQMREVRDRMVDHVGKLPLARESQDVLVADVSSWMSDAYLQKLADNEIRAKRPRARALAQEILRLVGESFRAAFEKWPSRIDVLAAKAAKGFDANVAISELPATIRDNAVQTIEEFLWNETGKAIGGQLAALFAEYQDIVRGQPEPLAREAYAPFAAACWRLVLKHA